MDLTVFIPTRGRTGIEHITLNEIKKFSNRRAVVVCPQNEVSHYRNNMMDHQRQYEVMPCDKEGIGPTRQWIIENSPTRGVVMLDDDMYFSHRPVPEQPRPLERVTTLEPMFEWISEQFDAGFPHGGISARQGNQHIERPWADCIRVNNAHFFDRDVFMAEGIRFDALPVMEDFHVTLSLLLKGYPNRVAYHYCWSQRGSGFRGGCSLYRTDAVQAQAAEALHAAFPNYVKVVEKESDSQHGAMAKRKDVNIGWLKAWADRSNKTALPFAFHNDDGFTIKFMYQPAVPDLRRR